MCYVPIPRLWQHMATKSDKMCAVFNYLLYWYNTRRCVCGCVWGGGGSPDLPFQPSTTNHTQNTHTKQASQQRESRPGSRPRYDDPWLVIGQVCAKHHQFTSCHRWNSQTEVMKLVTELLFSNNNLPVHRSTESSPRADRPSAFSMHIPTHAETSWPVATNSCCRS